MESANNTKEKDTKETGNAGPRKVSNETALEVRVVKLNETILNLQKALLEKDGIILDLRNQLLSNNEATLVKDKESLLERLDIKDNFQLRKEGNEWLVIDLTEKKN